MLRGAQIQKESVPAAFTDGGNAYGGDGPYGL